MSKYKLNADIDCLYLCFHLLSDFIYFKSVLRRAEQNARRARGFQHIIALCALCVLGFGFRSNTSPGTYMTALLGGLH